MFLSQLSLSLCARFYTALLMCFVDEWWVLHASASGHGMAVHSYSTPKAGDEAAFAIRHLLCVKILISWCISFSGQDKVMYKSNNTLQQQLTT